MDEPWMCQMMIKTSRACLQAQLAGGQLGPGALGHGGREGCGGCLPAARSGASGHHTQ